MCKKEKLQTALLISHCHMKKFKGWFFLFCVLPVLTNHDARFISRGQVCFYFTGNFPFKAPLPNDQRKLAKLREGVIFSSLALSVNDQQTYVFYWKVKYPDFRFLDLAATNLNLIQPKINEKGRNFYLLFQIFLLKPLYDFRIQVQIYQLIIKLGQICLTQKLTANMLSRRCQNSRKSRNTQVSEVNSNFYFIQPN